MNLFPDPESRLVCRLCRVAVVSLALLNTSCTLPLLPVTYFLTDSNKRHHEHVQSGAGYDLEGGAKMRVLEFDHMGELWDIKQLTQIQSELKTAAQTHKGGVLLVTYIHGWEHNAREKDGNLKAFRATIAALGKAGSTLQPDRAVVGVYVGWQGRQWKFTPPKTPPLNWLTMPTKLDYFHGRAAGHRTAGPAATHALHMISNAARTSPKSKVIMVGHSFGGLVIEHALMPTIAAGITQPNYRPPADLILMVNQAEHSLNASKFITALQASNSKVAPAGAPSLTGLPLMVSIGSKTDRATGKFLPLGTFIGRTGLSLTNTTMSGRGRKADEYGKYGKPQGKLLYSTPPAFEPFQNYESVTLVKGSAKAPERKSPEERYLEVMKANFALKQEYKPSERAFTKLQFITTAGTFTTSPKSHTHNKTPYWVMQADKEFIDGHNGLWVGGQAGEALVALVTVLSDLERHMGVPRQPLRVLSKPE